MGGGGVVVVVGRGVVTGHCQYQVVVPAAHIVSLVTHYVFKLIDFLKVFLLSQCSQCPEYRLNLLPGKKSELLIY